MWLTTCLGSTTATSTQGFPSTAASDSLPASGAAVAGDDGAVDDDDASQKEGSNHRKRSRCVFPRPTGFLPPRADRIPACAFSPFSKFRGVTKHRRSGRYEAHVWVRDTGKQLYLGGYAHEAFAAEAFDIAALKCKGSKAKLNFPPSRYEALQPFLQQVSLDELVMAIRRQSAGFARGSSVYRGVTHHPNGRWEARLGVPGQRHVYLGLFACEEDAARAYDRALVRIRGIVAATNFPLSEYATELAQFDQAASGRAQPAPAPAQVEDGAAGGPPPAHAFEDGLMFGGAMMDDPLLRGSLFPDLDFFDTMYETP